MGYATIVCYNIINMKSKYWLKWGLMSSGFVGLLSLILFIFAPCPPTNCFVEVWTLPFFLVYFFYVASGIIFKPFGIFGIILSGLIASFIIGAIIGLIIGKFKSSARIN